MDRRSLFVCFALLCACTASAQIPDTNKIITSPDGTREADVTTTAGGSLQVECTAGCGGAVGTQDVNIVEVGGNAVTTAVPVSGTVTAQNGSMAESTNSLVHPQTNAELIASTDVSNARVVYVHLQGTWSGVLQWEVSNDETNWVPAIYTDDEGGLFPVTTAMGGGALSYLVYPNGKYFRLLWTSVSGTINAHATFSQFVSPLAGLRIEDNAALTGDSGLPVFAVRNDGGSTQRTSANNDYGNPQVDAYGAWWTRTDHPNRIACSISSTATTSTLVTGCSAPGVGLSIYLTSLQWASSIISTTTNFMTIQDGTGGNCGANVTVHYQGFQAPAFAHVNVVFQTPIKVDANSEVCFLHPGAGTRLVNIQGFIAP